MENPCGPWTWGQKGTWQGTETWDLLVKHEAIFLYDTWWHPELQLGDTLTLVTDSSWDASQVDQSHTNSRCHGLHSNCSTHALPELHLTSPSRVNTLSTAGCHSGRLSTESKWFIIGALSNNYSPATMYSINILLFCRCCKQAFGEEIHIIV